MRIGIIGLGRIGAFHARTLAALPDVELVVTDAVGLEERLPLRSVEPGTTFPAGVPHAFFVDRFAGPLRAELAAFAELTAGRRAGLAVHRRRRGGDQLGRGGMRGVAARARPRSHRRDLS